MVDGKSKKTGSEDQTRWHRIITIVLLSCCLMLPGLLTTAKASYYEANSMWIDPSVKAIEFGPGVIFNVTVWLNLHEPSFLWQVGLQFDKTILNCTRAGFTATSYRSQFFIEHTTVAAGDIHNSEGIVYYCETLLDNDSCDARSGSLCWIEFQALASTQQTTLTLDVLDTYVLNPDLNDIAFNRYDATIMNTGNPGSHPPNAIWINPTESDVRFTVGTTFSVTVWLNLSLPSIAWQYKLRFDPTCLSVLSCVFTGPPVPPRGRSDFYKDYETQIPGIVIGNTEGYVLTGEAIVGVDVRGAGFGSLTTITFQVMTPVEETALYFDMAETYAIDPELNTVPVACYAASVKNYVPPLPIVSVAPPEVTTGLGRWFTVNVDVADVSDLYNWELKVYYDTAILSFNSANEGGFLQTGGSTVFVDDSNATLGMVYVGASLIGEIPGVTGSGTLVTLNFTAISIQNSSLTLADTMLLDSQLQDIVHADVNGYVIVGTGNILVSEVAPDKDTVGQGYCMNVSVTVTSECDFEESFNVRVYVNSSMIGEQQANLPANGELTLVFVWNTAGYEKGDYIVNATADILPGEIDPNDNTLVNGTIHVGLPGEVTGPGGEPDGVVDMRDIGYVCRDFGAVSGTSEYVSVCDINNDGKVDMRDIGIVCRNYMKTG